VVGECQRTTADGGSRGKCFFPVDEVKLESFCVAGKRESSRIRIAFHLTKNKNEHFQGLHLFPQIPSMTLFRN
jgi:hypothetical protein